MSSKSADAGSTTFIEDKFTQSLWEWTQDPEKNKFDEFGLVLNMGWPEIGVALGKESYPKFLDLLRSCFDKKDDDDDGDLVNAVYLYPPNALHVTVATFHAFTRQTRDPAERKRLLLHWPKVLEKASQHPEWPAIPLQIKLKSAQIGKKAGILLWEDTTGCTDKIRTIIKDTVDQSTDALRQVGIDSGTLQIPNIIHSTILRFRAVPMTPGERVQQRFEELVKPKLSEIFDTPLELSVAKLVNEKIPYMHIPMDKEHVLKVLRFDD